ncbi:MAG: hypoxanthine phosphoribosyltransferase [Clostridiales Family XIII bacterium]|jgi:hypoxanthine phosphoribosyltransferase|nr:hypoxanthine phosphoribosyltransferase [Clostridiales Family XIII bacterium]
MNASEFKAKYVLDTTLICREDVEARIVELAEQINIDYAGKEILLVGILRGSVMFMSELSKSITLDMAMDFMDVSSYGDDIKSSCNVKILKDLDESIEGANVIIVEDIIDSGNTLSYLKEFMIDRCVASLKIVTLLDKPEGRTADIEADYVGFKIPNEFVVGYGLDVAQHYRNLPYIATVKVLK